MIAVITQIAALEEKLIKLLSTLKKNKEQVPLETLKTYYSIPYNTLREDIRVTLSDYVKALVCNGLFINASDQEETIEIINSTIKKSNIMKLISTAAYKEYDVEKVYTLAMTLRLLVIKAILPVLERHTYYCIETDNMESTILSYNTVLGCFWIDNAWVMLDQTPSLLGRKL